MSPPVPTLADVGRAAGVSAMTVSLVMRNSPRISRATQTRVRKAARQLGYRPDPHLSALVARRDNTHPHHVVANLAVLIDDRWDDFSHTSWIKTVLDGMRTACARLGYSLDVFNIQRDLLSSKNPDRILQGRGIRAITILSLVEQDLILPLQWSHYAVISIGSYTPFRIQWHRVGGDAFAAANLVGEKLAALGYRRLGLANRFDNEERMRFEWLGGLTKEHFSPKPRWEVVPPYLPEGSTETGILKWIEKYKPECVVSNYWRVYLWLKEAGYRVPQDIGFVCLSNESAENVNISGISKHLDIAGEAAVEQLHSMLLRGETGEPKIPREILIHPHWVQGKTVRRIKRT
ncbi:MAG: hypothetical protein B9S32_02880 [Verrucomicrobia bacterium Tous-C9LFEB]|nr:MAG: hypothetical protein B9S32_02880 [Verrucomicrobia bacterium Tous-C9LFEB]